MTVAYATEAELTDWLPTGTTVDDADRLLARATEVIDDQALGIFEIDDDTQLPTDTVVAAALRDATCAQVEFWLEVGEEHDINGLAGQGVSIGSMRLDRLPPVLGPRARRILRSAGLFTSAGVGDVDAGWRFDLPPSERVSP